MPMTRPLPFNLSKSQAQERALATRWRPSFARMPSQEIEGAGKAGRDSAPAASRAKLKSTRVSHHRFAGNTRPSLRNGFNGFLRDLPGEPGFLATITPEKR